MGRTESMMLARKQVQAMASAVDTIRLNVTQQVEDIFKGRMSDMWHDIPQLVKQGQSEVIDLIKDLLGINVETAQEKDLLKNRLDSIDANLLKIIGKCCAEEGPFTGEPAFYDKLGKMVAALAYKPAMMFGAGILRNRAKGPWTKVTDPLNFIMDQIWKLGKDNNEFKDKIIETIQKSRGIKGTPAGANAASSVGGKTDVDAPVQRDKGYGDENTHTVGE